MSRRVSSLTGVFAVPLALAVASLIGLTGALLGDGAWDLIGTGLLATALGAIVRARLGHRLWRRKGSVRPLRNDA